MQNIQNIQKIEIPNADLYYIDNFIFDDNEYTFYNKLLKEIPWTQQDVIVYGNKFKQPRLSSLLGEKNKTYSYSGIKRIPEPLTETTKFLLNKVQETVNILNNQCKYTSVLCNYYRNGHDYIGPHSDDEKDLIENNIIASLSFGSDRFFDIYDKQNNNKKIMRLTLSDGSLLLMGNNMQKYYKHGVPVQKKIKDGRINLTYRSIKN